MSLSHQAGAYIMKLLYEIASLDTDLIILVSLLVTVVIVLDGAVLVIRRRRKASGVDHKTQAVGIEGSKTLPVRNYISDIQGLAGRPDALLVEDGCIIPVERKPLARKIRDRYVAQLLVYMRLVEEFEGKRPPYGYLILGPSCRRFKIMNSPDRQAWLQKMIDEMRAVLGGEEARPEPHPRKCGRCGVQRACPARAGGESKQELKAVS